MFAAAFLHESGRHSVIKLTLKALLCYEKCNCMMVREKKRFLGLRFYVEMLVECFLQDSPYLMQRFRCYNHPL